MARKDRLKEVFDYVRENFPIHTQSDFAEKIRYNRTYLSSAMHGNEKNLTDKLFYNICAAYPNVFNLNYLLTGEGSLLQSNKEAVLGRYPAPPGMVSEDVPSESLPLWADTLIRITKRKEKNAEIRAPDATGGAETGKTWKTNKTDIYGFGGIFG